MKLLSSKILIATLLCIMAFQVVGCVDVDKKTSRNESDDFNMEDEYGDDYYNNDYYQKVDIKEILEQVPEGTIVLQPYRIDLSKEGIKELINSREEEVTYDINGVEFVINSAEIIKLSVDETKDLPKSIRELNDESKIVYYEIFYNFEILNNGLKDEEDLNISLEVNDEIWQSDSIEFKDEGLSSGTVKFRVVHEKFDLGNLVISINGEIEEVDYEI